ncbi:hypothetical protein HAP94_06515 [Acidithiobacillus ferrivorans]|nr:hypothetical protein [Acidithiobacillus ferrivorans]
MSKMIAPALAIVILVILACLAADAISLVVGGVLGAGMDPVASALQGVLAGGNS